MRKDSSSLPSAAMIVALAALVIALGGTGYATTHLAAKSPHATAASTNHHSQVAAETKLFKKLAKKVKVARAHQADNAKTLGGSPASTYQRTSKLMFATVNTGIHPTIARGRGATGVVDLDPPNGGEYDVTFNQPIGKCTWVATAGPGNNNDADAVFAVVRGDDPATHPNTVRVILYTGFDDNEFIGQGFHVIVACP